MADAPAKPEGKSAFGFLGKKVFGKIPVWVIAVAAVGAYYWYSKKKKGAAGTVTDPAGNTCSAVNAATGYCPGTPEDLAAQQANAGTTDTSGTGTTDTTGTGGAAGGSAGSGGSLGGGSGTTGNGSGTGTTGTTGTAGTLDTGTGPLLTWTDASGQTQTGSPADFQAAFAATGSNAGDIVPGGTGQPVPLQPGQSYTDAGPAPSASAKPGAQNAHAQHLAHVAHVQHLAHVKATRKQPAGSPR